MDNFNSAHKKIASDNPNCCLFKVDLNMNYIEDTSDYEEELVEKLQLLKRSKNLELFILNKSNAKRAVLYACLYYGLFDGKERTIADCARIVKRGSFVVDQGISKITAMLRKNKSKSYISNESGIVSSDVEKTYRSYADFLQSCIEDETNSEVKKRLSKIKRDCIEYHADKDIIK